VIGGSAIGLRSVQLVFGAHAVCPLAGLISMPTFDVPHSPPNGLTRRRQRGIVGAASVHNITASMIAVDEYAVNTMRRTWRAKFCSSGLSTT